jgi:leader peptidase (prepilin peptidase) / N-methyltransferase
MSAEILFFSIIAITVSICDFKKHIIPDAIMLPAIIGLFGIAWIEGAEVTEILIKIVMISILFALPVLLNMAFGGGDIRFAIFVAILLSTQELMIFLILSGVLQTVFVTISKRKVVGFAPAMSMASLLAYYQIELWELI